MFRRLMQQVDRLLGRGVVDEEFFEGLEEALIEADTHVSVAQKILQELRRAVREERLEDPGEIKARLQSIIADGFRSQQPEGLAVEAEGPTVYLFVGVNGVGKTTTIAKVAALLKRKGYSVLLAAGDTFRAAAIEQLEVWAQRIGADIVRSQPGADSGAVIFDAIQAAKARGIQFVLADTAGRQHSKANLMSELQKVVRVIEKALGHRPTEVLLVLDANTGQNAISQAKEFNEALGITGIILTKLDGTAKGGVIIGICDELKIPVRYIGIGESIEDLREFNPDEFVNALFED
jgi:fused signal recognition particle receptor